MCSPHVALLVAIGALVRELIDEPVRALKPGDVARGQHGALRVAVVHDRIRIVLRELDPAAGVVDTDGAGTVRAILLVANLGSLVLQGTMKLFFARPRPQLPYAHVLPDYSFPSGHTMNAVIVYGALALILGLALRNRFLRTPNVTVCDLDTEKKTLELTRAQLQGALASDFVITSMPALVAQ